VQLNNGRTEHLVLTCVPWRRVESVDPICILSESGLIGLHLREIIGGKDVVTQELVVAILEYLDAVALYVTDLTRVFDFALLASSLFLPLGLRSSFLLLSDVLFLRPGGVFLLIERSRLYCSRPVRSAL
jgi:hypothetical protein